MTSLHNTCLEPRSPEYLTTTPFTSKDAQKAVHRLRSSPGLMIVLVTPTETAGVRAIEQVERLLVDFGVPFETDGASFAKLGNGACFYVVVDVHMTRGSTISALLSAQQGARGSDGVRS